jgi:hypothetical protein
MKNSIQAVGRMEVGNDGEGLVTSWVGLPFYNVGRNYR